MKQEHREFSRCSSYFSEVQMQGFQDMEPFHVHDTDFMHE